MTNIFELFDYRRQVQALYSEVRRLAQDEPAAAHSYWRKTRDLLFGQHSQSALSEEQRPNFKGLNYYAYNPAYHFVAQVQLDPVPGPLHGRPGDPLAFYRFGVVNLPVGSLELYWFDSYGGGVFLPFRDGTSGNTTYGGGRYLLDTVKGADLGSREAGTLILDFNFAYHPSCHYNPVWSCPLAPAPNRLKVPIEAGERNYP